MPSSIPNPPSSPKPRAPRVTITERHTGRWYIGLDEPAFRALVSIVRHAGATNWKGVDPETEDGACRLLKALNRAW